MIRLILSTCLLMTFVSCKKEDDCENCYIVNTKINDFGNYTIIANQECGSGQKEFHDANTYNKYNLGDYLEGTGCTK